MLIFKHFPKSDHPHSRYKIPTPKDMGRYMSKKPCFRGSFETQLGKWVETVLQYERQRLYNIY